MSAPSTVEIEDLRRTGVTLFEGRLPDPAEIIQWGGKPGVQYLMVDSRNLHAATNLPPVRIANKDCRWGLTKGIDVFQVVGPKGATTMMVLSRGEPIPGADPANGIPEWFYDDELLNTTGLTAPYGDSNAQQEPQAAQNDAGSSPQPGVRQKGGNPSEGGPRV